MRAVFGLAGLLVVMAIIGVLMKQNLGATRSSTAPAASSGVAVPAVDATKNVREQSQQIQNQVRDDLNQALQQGSDRMKDLEK